MSNAADLDLVAVDAEAVLRQMASAGNSTNIFSLDACRNNPFSTIPDVTDNGLAEMKVPTGTFVAFATAPREVALDGIGRAPPVHQSVGGHESDPKDACGKGVPGS